MKNIWANFRTFNYNNYNKYLRRDHTFMYFQIKSDLREKYRHFGIFTKKKPSLGLGITKNCYQ